jgi:hypothetical protein
MSDQQGQVPEEDLPETGQEVTDDELEQDPEEVPDGEFLTPESAAADPTIDDEEQHQDPHSDLPEGTRAADYEAQEQRDGSEETPSVERGQREG